MYATGTAKNDETCDVDRDVCAILLAVAAQPMDGPQTKIELGSELRRVKHGSTQNSYRNHCLANQTQTVCGLIEAEVAEYGNDGDGDADDDGGQNERLA